MRLISFVLIASLPGSAAAQTHDWTQPGHPPLVQQPTLETIHRDDTGRRAREGEADLTRMRAVDAAQVRATQTINDTARLAPYTPTPTTPLIPALEHKIEAAEDPL